MATTKSKWLQGKYQLINPNKYKGDKRNVVFRSSYELKMFRYCDLTETVLEWSAEEVVIPYRDPITGSYRRYFVDIWLKHKTPTGEIREKIIEVKPAKQLYAPVTPKRKTKKYLKEVETYIINKSKWEAATKYAKKKGIDFIIFTEKELGIH